LRSGAAAQSAEKELNDVKVGLRHLMGNGIEFRSARTEQLPRGPTGKFKWIVSRLDPRGDGMEREQK
jgi:hypothetical protein